MKFSSKGRYAIAALVYMAQKNGNEEQITILAISQALGISKIYLEQVFSMLKRADIVTSIKGAQGGYRLTNPPEEITVGGHRPCGRNKSIREERFRHSQRVLSDR